MKMLNGFVICLIMFGLTACATKKEMLVPIEIYIVQDESISKEDFSKFIDENAPILTENDIESYNWSMHSIYLKKTYLEEHSKKEETSEINDGFYEGGSLWLKAKEKDRFILVVDNEILYDGSVRQGLSSSYYPVGPVISDLDNGIGIGFIELENESNPDIRNDTKLYQALKNNKQLIESSK